MMFKGQISGNTLMLFLMILLAIVGVMVYIGLTGGFGDIAKAVADSVGGTFGSIQKGLGIG